MIFSVLMPATCKFVREKPCLKQFLNRIDFTPLDVIKLEVQRINAIRNNKIQITNCICFIDLESIRNKLMILWQTSFIYNLSTYTME